MRSQKTWPEDPNKHLVDYFGQYRDPLWDRMEEWQEEMENIRNDIPDKQSKVEALELELQSEKRKTWAFEAYKLVDNLDAPVSDFKSITLNFFIFLGPTWLQILRAEAFRLR